MIEMKILARCKCNECGRIIEEVVITEFDDFQIKEDLTISDIKTKTKKVAQKKHGAKTFKTSDKIICKTCQPLSNRRPAWSK